MDSSHWGLYSDSKSYFLFNKEGETDSISLYGPRLAFVLMVTCIGLDRL